MKYVFTFLLTLFAFSLSAQTPFEGKIVYNVVSNVDKKQAVMTIYFGPQKIRMELFDSASQKQENVFIVHLDSGKFVTLRPSSRTYKISPLKKRIVQTSQPSVTQLAGHKVTPVALESAGLPGLIAMVLQNPVLYPADDLFFPVPEIYSANPELLMVHKNHIVLGAAFWVTPERQWDFSGASDGVLNDSTKISAMAALVQAQTLDASLFSVPSSYEREQDYVSTTTDSTAAWDSAAVAVDSVYTPQKPAVKQKKKVPAKKKANTKQSAVRRKYD